MRVLLVSVNREKMPCPVFPLGLAYIGRALRDAGQSVETVDLCFSRDVQIGLEDVIRQFQPEVIGLSLRNLDNLTYPNPISYLKEVEEIVRICRHLTPAKLILGGSGFSLAPEELLQYCDVDYGIVGEGEEAFVQLLRSLEGKLPLSPSPHLLIKGGPFPPSAIGARVSPIPIPDRASLNARRYQEEGGMINLQTKRGVPFPVSTALTPCWKGRRFDSAASPRSLKRSPASLRNRGWITFISLMTSSIILPLLRRPCVARWQRGASRSNGAHL